MNLANKVGFDYPQAIREINQHMTYEEIAKALGYESKNSVYGLLNGVIPSHIHGEALWGLYQDVIGKKAPLNTTKRTPQFLSLTTSGP